MVTDVFISYSTQNTPLAEMVCATLEAEGLTCWIAPRDILPAQSWTEAIIDGINNTKVLVLVLSNASNASPQVLREVERAVHKRVPLLVFRIEEVTLSKSLEYLVSVEQWLDVLTEPIEPHLQRLTQAAKRLIASPSEPGIARLTESAASRTEPQTPPSIAPVPAALPAHNLPRQLTSFIGRDKESAEVKLLLMASPLVTLTGIGGTGKTRLALQVGMEALLHYPDGVWLAELGLLTTPALLAQTVAQALGVREEPGRPITETLQEHLKNRHLLLLLDNCEHMIAEAAQFADSLLRASAELSILASSREPLGLPGEAIYRVPSLSLPDRRMRIDLLTSDNLLQFGAVRLFIERAAALTPGFTLTPTNARAVAQICQRLDGIPLAIELAAARVKVLSAEQIAARLNDRFRLLTGGNRTALPRQQTLRALIDWSYDLLTEPERTLLRRLSIFAGGWTLDAAEQVCSAAGVQVFRSSGVQEKPIPTLGEELRSDVGSGVSEPEYLNTRTPEHLNSSLNTRIPEYLNTDDVLDLLTSLVDKSLVVYEEEGEAARYRLLETIRQYANDRLQESGEAAQIGACHLAYYLQLAQQVAAMPPGVEQSSGYALLETEHDNLRAALEQSLQDRGGEGEKGRRGEAEPEDQSEIENRKSKIDAAALCLALTGFWESQGRFREGRAAQERCLASLPESADDSHRARVTGSAGWFAYQMADYEPAILLQEQSLILYRELGDVAGEANALNDLALTNHELGCVLEAHALMEQSLQLAEVLGDDSKRAGRLSNLGLMAIQMQQYEPAQRRLEEARAIYARLQDRFGEAACLCNLTELALKQQQWREASDLAQQSLQSFRALNERPGMAYALANLAEAGLHLRDWESSGEWAREALTICAEADMWGLIPPLLESLARARSVFDAAQESLFYLIAAQKIREELRMPRTPQEQQELEAIETRFKNCMEANDWTTLYARATAAHNKDILAEALAYSSYNLNTEKQVNRVLGF